MCVCHHYVHGDSSRQRVCNTHTHTHTRFVITAPQYAAPPRRNKPPCFTHSTPPHTPRIKQQTKQLDRLDQQRYPSQCNVQARKPRHPASRGQGPGGCRFVLGCGMQGCQGWNPLQLHKLCDLVYTGQYGGTQWLGMWVGRGFGDAQGCWAHARGEHDGTGIATAACMARASEVTPNEHIAGC